MVLYLDIQCQQRRSRS